MCMNAVLSQDCDAALDALAQLVRSLGKFDDLYRQLQALGCGMGRYRRDLTRRYAAMHWLAKQVDNPTASRDEFDLYITQWTLQFS